VSCGFVAGARAVEAEVDTHLAWRLGWRDNAPTWTPNGMASGRTRHRGLAVALTSGFAVCLCLLFVEAIYGHDASRLIAKVLAGM
jgi:hypothetical protein